MKGLSIIVPAFNESGNLQAAIAGVQDAIRLANIGRSEIIVVDDGSTDGTARVARECGAEEWDRRHPDVRADDPATLRLVQHGWNLGLRAAYETGLRIARYDRVTWVPGDGEIARDSLVNIFSAIGTADLVIPYHGTPHLRPWFRRALTWISTNEINLLMGKRLHYWQGPVVYPTSLARSLPRTIDGFFCMAEMLACAMTMDPTYVQVPLTHQERTYGVSKAVSWKRIWQAQMAVFGFWWRFKAARSTAHDLYALAHLKGLH